MATGLSSRLACKYNLSVFESIIRILSNLKSSWGYCGDVLDGLEHASVGQSWVGLHVASADEVGQLTVARDAKANRAVLSP